MVCIKSYTICYLLCVLFTKNMSSSPIDSPFLAIRTTAPGTFTQNRSKKGNPHQNIVILITRTATTSHSHNHSIMTIHGVLHHVSLFHLSFLFTPKNLHHIATNHHLITLTWCSYGTHANIHCLWSHWGRTGLIHFEVLRTTVGQLYSFQVSKPSQDAVLHHFHYFTNYFFSITRYTTSSMSNLIILPIHSAHITATS